MKLLLTNKQTEESWVNITSLAEIKSLSCDKKNYWLWLRKIRRSLNLNWQAPVHLWKLLIWVYSWLV